MAASGQYAAAETIMQSKRWKQSSLRDHLQSEIWKQLGRRQHRVFGKGKGQKSCGKGYATEWGKGGS
eukprot:1153119-Pelagomonas_calceolata.AAC.15